MNEPTNLKPRLKGRKVFLELLFKIFSLWKHVILCSVQNLIGNLAKWKIGFHMSPCLKTAFQYLQQSANQKSYPSFSHRIMTAVETEIKKDSRCHEVETKTTASFLEVITFAPVECERCRSLWSSGNLNSHPCRRLLSANWSVKRSLMKIENFILWTFMLKESRRFYQVFLCDKHAHGSFLKFVFITSIYINRKGIGHQRLKEEFLEIKWQANRKYNTSVGWSILRSLDR